MEMSGSSSLSTLQESNVSDESPAHSCGQGLRSIGLMNTLFAALI